MKYFYKSRHVVSYEYFLFRFVYNLKILENNGFAQKLIQEIWHHICLLIDVYSFSCLRHRSVFCLFDCLCVLLSSPFIQQECQSYLNSLHNKQRIFTKEKLLFIESSCRNRVFKNNTNKSVYCVNKDKNLKCYSTPGVIWSQIHW